MHRVFLATQLLTAECSRGHNKPHTGGQGVLRSKAVTKNGNNLTDMARCSFSHITFQLRGRYFRLSSRDSWAADLTCHHAVIAISWLNESYENIKAEFCRMGKLKKQVWFGGMPKSCCQLKFNFACDTNNTIIQQIDHLHRISSSCKTHLDQLKGEMSPLISRPQRCWSWVTASALQRFSMFDCCVVQLNPSLSYILLKSAMWR